MPAARRGSRVLSADLWCEGALRFENAKSRLEYSYVKIGSDPDADATAFKLLVAAISVGIAAVITLTLGSVIKHTATLFFCSVMLSSWYGGL